MEFPGANLKLKCASHNSRDSHNSSRPDTCGSPFETRRFTRYEHDQGDTTGWRFEAGWFRYVSGLEWAWFSREIREWKS